MSTIEFGVEMPSLSFRVLGTIFSVAVVILWMIVAVGTAKGAWNGRLFCAPRLANLKKEERQPKGIDDKEKEVLK